MSKHYIVAMIVGVALLGVAAIQVEAQVHMTPARAAAIRECSLLSQKYPETTFSSLEFELYRACMARHGQVE